MVVAPLLSPIGKELGVATEALGAPMTTYAIVVGVFALVAGPISDRVGRCDVLLFGPRPCHSLGPCPWASRIFHSVWRRISTLLGSMWSKNDS